MVDQIARAVSDACARLDCGVGSTGGNTDPDEEIRRKAALTARGQREKPLREIPLECPHCGQMIIASAWSPSGPMVQYFATLIRPPGRSTRIRADRVGVGAPRCASFGR